MFSGAEIFQCGQLSCFLPAKGGEPYGVGHPHNVRRQRPGQAAVRGNNNIQQAKREPGCFRLSFCILSVLSAYLGPTKIPINIAPFLFESFQ